MHEFLLTATDRTGKRATTSVMADSAQEAVAILEAQGCTDITLHTDDVMAAAGTSFETVNHAPCNPAEVVKVRGMSQWQFFQHMVVRMYQRGWALVLIALLLIAYDWFITRRFSLISIASIGVLLLPVGFGLYSAFWGISGKYARMNESFAWGRWQEVLDQLPAFRRRLPDLELDAREAAALAGLGRLDEGLAQLEPHGRSAEIPEWMYQGRLAEVFEIAGKYDRAMECTEKALHDAPNNPTLQLGMALSLLKNRAETARARQLIDSAQQQPLSDVLMLLVPEVKGLLALNENRPHEAEPLLLQAIDGLKPLAAAHPGMGLHVDASRAYLAIAYAQSGERHKAQEQFRLAEPRLKALNARRILDRYAEEMAKLG